MRPTLLSTLFPYTTLFRSTLRAIDGGWLAQQNDDWSSAPALEAVTRRAPSDEELETLKFAWAVVRIDRKSTRLNSSHVAISYAVFCLRKQSAEEDVHIAAR